ncbi:ABC transporter permease [Peribacillus frigoritolerans]|uniref:ABC transporter permease n=1 Tax=Peribacillus frigoritolerans TaxID=450367 RepID=UPI0021622CF6|nr:FtsX-like permease family protein [Peribacillus frigoritolerans]
MEFTDNKIIVPLLLHQNIYQKTSIDSIEIEAFISNEMEKMGQEVVNILNNDLSDIYTGQYEVFNLKELQESVSGLTRIMTGLIGGVASISLLVAGIGVMNIMLVSVTERTREIGIRKALGATRRLILLQFLIEALIQTVLGGAIGIILAYGGINLLAFVLGWPVIFSPIVILGGLFFSMILGVVFGLLPANKAAKLEPVEALRYE